MPQSLSNILVHFVFSTKNREPFIRPEIESELHPYIATIFKANESPALTINGTADHVHILCVLSRKISVAALIEDVKTNSSSWIKTRGDAYADFYWQKGYGSFSIGQSNVAALKTYIAAQKTHHRKISFQDEYRAFLKKYEIDFDERYVWQ